MSAGFVVFACSSPQDTRPRGERTHETKEANQGTSRTDVFDTQAFRVDLDRFVDSFRGYSGLRVSLVASLARQ